MADEDVDVTVQRCRVQKRLAILAGGVEQPAHGGKEAHVGHPVGLVHHGDLDVGERDLAALDQVLEAAGARNEDLHAVAQRGALAVVADAAVDGGDALASYRRDGAKSHLHLCSKLTRRDEHERRRTVRPRTRCAQHERDTEGKRLARSGGRAAADVVAGDGVGQRRRLDGKRLGDLVPPQDLHDIGGQAELSKGGSGQAELRSAVWGGTHERGPFGAPPASYLPATVDTVPTD